MKRMKSLGAAEVVTEDFAASHRMKDLLTVCHSEGTFVRELGLYYALHTAHDC